MTCKIVIRSNYYNWRDYIIYAYIYFAKIYVAVHADLLQ